MLLFGYKCMGMNKDTPFTVFRAGMGRNVWIVSFCSGMHGNKFLGGIWYAL